MGDQQRLRWAAAATLVACATALAISNHAVGVAVLAAATSAALLLFLRIAVRHGRLTMHLRRRSTRAQVVGTDVRLVAAGGAVFVAGLARPEIFCDRRLLDDLDHAELTAVVLHERAHQLAHDPLRSAVVAVVAPLLARTSSGRVWLERRAADREIAADRYALAHGADRSDIASALLKVPTTQQAHAVAFASGTELRLRALLGDDLPPRPVPWRLLATGAVVGTVACLLMIEQVTAIAQACCPL